MKIKITVIVPVYNVAGYLSICLDSLIRQTYRNIEIICVNDGSTDNSGEILKEYAKKDKRIKIIEKKNGGLSSARNAALEKCSTEYVMFCDSDDSFNEKMCEKMLDVIEKDKSDVAICEKNIIYYVHEGMRKSDEKYYSLKYSGKKRINDEIILNTNVSVLNKIFRMDIIKKNKIVFPNGLNNEDFYFCNAYMSVARTISFVHEPLYNYARRENSIMSNNFEVNTCSIDHLRVAEELFSFYKEEGFLDRHADLFWRQWLLSYWFSYNYTSPKLRNEVQSEARLFVRENLEKFPPSNVILKKEIKNIFLGRLLMMPKRVAKKIFGEVYKKINVSYKQQRYININIERLQKKYDDLLGRLDNLMKDR